MNKPVLTIRFAETTADHAAVRGLCRAYRALLAERWPDFPQFVETYYAEAGFEDLLTQLPEIHNRPTGALFVADLGGQIVGCGMTRDTGDGVCEITRVFVDDAARGHGAGRGVPLSIRP